MRRKVRDIPGPPLSRTLDSVHVRGEMPGAKIFHLGFCDPRGREEAPEEGVGEARGRAYSPFAEKLGRTGMGQDAKGE